MVFLPELVQGPTIITVNLFCADCADSVKVRYHNIALYSPFSVLMNSSELYKVNNIILR